MPPDSTNVNAYLRTKVLTAGPEESRLMLLDGAVKFARQGRDGLARKDWEAVFNGFSRCRNILVELLSGMRPEVDPELCRRMSTLYTFMYTQLMDASYEKDVAKADRVIELLEYDRRTWAMLVEKLTRERAVANRASDAEAVDAAGLAALAHRPLQNGAEAGAAGESAAYRPLSVQG